MSTQAAFTPVPVRARRDGWTPERQAAFIAALKQTRCVAAACRTVGMSWQTAYRLRARAGAVSFAAAWDAALAPPALPADLTGRALGGVVRPITYRRRQVGERRRCDNRLAKYILRVRAPGRYGTAGEHRRPVGTDFVAALAALEADLAAGLAPHADDDSSGDAARGSSPSARAAAAALLWGRRRAMTKRSGGPMLAEVGAEAAALTRPFRICDPP